MNEQHSVALYRKFVMRFHPWLATGLLALSGLAQASVTLYTDAGAFNGALASSGNAGASVSADFASAAAAHGVSDSFAYGVLDPDTITVGNLTFAGSNDGNAAVFLTQNTFGVTGAFFTHQNFHQGMDNTVTITFAAPVTAVAFEGNVSNVFETGSTAVPMVLTTDAGDVAHGYSSTLYDWSAPGVTAPKVFNGLISDQAFSKLTISTQTDALSITSFMTVAASPVPEADVSLLALVGLGVAGLASRRKLN